MCYDTNEHVDEYARTNASHFQNDSICAVRVGDPDENVRALALEGISSIIKRGDHEAGLSQVSDVFFCFCLALTSKRT